MADDTHDTELIDKFRRELDRSAEDLERLTTRLQDQALVVERLEMAVAELLDMMSTPAVMVDGDGRLMAVSRGAVDRYPGLSTNALGEQPPAGLPRRLVDDIVAVAEATEAATAADRSARRRNDSSTRWVTVRGAEVIALPGHWALAVLGSDDG